MLAPVTEELDLSAILASCKGEKASRPKMAALLLYSYAVGISSSHRIAEASVEQITSSVPRE
jgi:hypothetical protein